MPKILDARMVDDIEIISITHKPNVERTVITSIGELEDIETEVTYVVETHIRYWLLDSKGKRLKKVTTTHDIYPLDYETNGVDFVNNLDKLGPSLKVVAIKDRQDLTVTPK